MMCHIALCSLTWEAFATMFAGVLAFVAGIGAIVGAVKVGQRQVAILSDQAAIQGKQVEIASRALELEELKVRVDLFADRLEVYDATSAWLLFIISHARPPGHRLRGVVEAAGEREISTNFRLQMDRARFLFRSSVHERLKHLSDLASQVRVNQVRVERAESEEIVSKAIDAEHEALLEIGNTDLVELFGEEMSLGDYGRTSCSPAVAPKSDEG